MTEAPDMSGIGSIYFDLDGTLTDPKIGITRSIRHALIELGHHAPSEDELIWCIGPPLLGSLKTLLGRDELAEPALQLYRQRFSEIGIYENGVYPDILDVLASLHRSGRRLFVASSKPLIYVERIIDHFGMRPYFERVFGSELDGVRADKTELLTYALGETGDDAGRAVMIGDRRHDMIGAINNRMTAVGVAYGYGGRQELIAAGAHHICLTPGALLDCIPGIRAFSGEACPRT
jgi:phosphoglycolate phosphatase